MLGLTCCCQWPLAAGQQSCTMAVAVEVPRWSSPVEIAVAAPAKVSVAAPVKVVAAVTVDATAAVYVVA